MRARAISIAGFAAGAACGFFFVSVVGRSEPRLFYSLDRKQNDREIIQLIDNSSQYAEFAIFTFTKPEIADALVRAAGRGVRVFGIADRLQSDYKGQKVILAKLAKAGIPVEVQKHAVGIMHIKAIVTDRGYALGSYNWTQSATLSNDEVLEVGDASGLHDRLRQIIEQVIRANAG